jgi:hypothetical protein
VLVDGRCDVGIEGNGCLLASQLHMMIRTHPWQWLKHKPEC